MKMTDEKKFYLFFYDFFLIIPEKLSNVFSILGGRLTVGQRPLKA